MNNFSQYVTRTAFQLSLSRNMIVALEIAKKFDEGDNWFAARYHAGEHPFTYNNDFVTPIRSLIHRGLVVHQERPKDNNDRDWKYYKLTEAGHHVYELCVLAGLIIVPEAKEQAA